MRTDRQIQQDIIEELSFDPSVCTEIGVSVRNGVVKLSGQVNALTEKSAAEKAARRVPGVCAIVEDIQVGAMQGAQRSDTELALDIMRALQWNVAVQQEEIKIKVENGVVVMEGEVLHDMQRRMAASAIETMQGVRAIINLVKLRPVTVPEGISEKILNAFERSARLDASKVMVSVDGSKVILTGSVRSLSEKEDAERAARVAPGITEIESRIAVDSPLSR